jgi:hypothetical protein
MTARSLTRALRWIAPLAVAFTLSCQFIIGLQDPVPGEAPVTDEAGVDTGTDAGADVDPCHHVFPPPPAAVDDDPIGDVGPITFAMHYALLGGRLGWDAGAYDGGGGNTGFPAPQVGINQSFGFDLDNACTCQGDNIHGGAPSCASAAKQICDQDGGVDNAIFNDQLYNQLYTLSGLMDPANGILSINDGISKGNTTILMRITGYNGRANDNNVTVEVSAVQRTHQAPAQIPGCENAPPRPYIGMNDVDSGPAWGPAWDGCDVWDPLKAAQAITSYVVDHQLVVVAKGTLPTVVGSATLELQFPLSVGVLVPKPGGGFTYEDGVFSGRADSSSLLAVLFTTLHIKGSKTPVCFDPTLAPVLKSAVCNALDIRTDPSQDFFVDDAGQLVSCNAASFVFSFRQDPANVTDAAPSAAPELFNGCEDSGVTFVCNDF